MPSRRDVNGMRVVDGLLRKHGFVRDNEIWVHGMWTWDKWFKCIRAKVSGRKLVRMTHGALSPEYLGRQGKWRKKIVGFLIERPLFRLCDKVVFTGPWEEEWFRRWCCSSKMPQMEIVDLKQFFAIRQGVEKGARVREKFSAEAQRCGEARRGESALHVLYVGRRHPLKGVQYLEEAVREINASSPDALFLRIVSDHFGDELERDWSWCDVLCLPTLSENFGLVVAEALARGKPVITTDGAPAWEGQEGVIYLKGYRDGDFATRVKLLREALRGMLGLQGGMLCQN